MKWNTKYMCFQLHVVAENQSLLSFHPLIKKDLQYIYVKSGSTCKEVAMLCYHISKAAQNMDLLGVW